MRVQIEFSGVELARLSEWAVERQNVAATFLRSLPVKSLAHAHWTQEFVRANAMLRVLASGKVLEESDAPF